MKQNGTGSESRKMRHLLFTCTHDPLLGNQKTQRPNRTGVGILVRRLRQVLRA